MDVDPRLIGKSPRLVAGSKRRCGCSRSRPPGAPKPGAPKVEDERRGE